MSSGLFRNNDTYELFAHAYICIDRIWHEIAQKFSYAMKPNQTKP